jgi:hypothetical protein
LGDRAPSTGGRDGQAAGDAIGDAAAVPGEAAGIEAMGAGLAHGSNVATAVAPGSMLAIGAALAIGSALPMGAALAIGSALPIASALANGKALASTARLAPGDGHRIMGDASGSAGDAAGAIGEASVPGATDASGAGLWASTLPTVAKASTPDSANMVILAGFMGPPHAWHGTRLGCLHRGWLTITCAAAVGPVRVASACQSEPG